MLTEFIHFISRLFIPVKPHKNNSIPVVKPVAVKPQPQPLKPQKLSAAELQQSESLFYDLMFGKIRSGENSSSLENQILHKLGDVLQDVESISKNIVELPSIVTRIELELGKPEHDAEKIAGLIEQDPVIAANLLKLVNSPLFKPGTQELTNLKQAITYLGEKKLNQLIITAVIQKLSDTPKIYFKLFGEQIWKHSLQTAIICADLTRLNKVSQSTAYLTGLIHDIGKIAIFKILVTQLQSTHPDQTVNSSIFRQALTDHSTLLSCKIAESWKLPESINLALKHQLNSEEISPNSLSKILYQANLYSEIFMLLEQQLIDPEFTDRLCLSRNIDVEYLHQLKNLFSNR